MTCKNKASVLVKGIYGEWVYACSYCLMNSHMLVDVRADKRQVTHFAYCECNCPETK